MKAYIDGLYGVLCPTCGNLMPNQSPPAAFERRIIVACINPQCQDSGEWKSYARPSVELGDV